MLKNIINKKVYMLITLLILSIISSSVLAYVYEITADRIELEYRNDLIYALNIVLPEYCNDPYNDTIDIDNNTIYLAKDNASNTIGYAIVSSSDKGYSGKISVLVGVDTAGKVTGVFIIKHTETPGLGTNIEKEEFLKLYVGLYNETDIKIQKDGGKIATTTGATISPRAVSLAVAKAIKFVNEHLIKEGVL